MQDIQKAALITGIAGQDGAYLAKFLLDKGYKIYGAGRHLGSDDRLFRLKKLGINDHPNLQLVEYDLLDPNKPKEILKEHVDITEIYNLAAISSVAEFDKNPNASKITANSPKYILEAILETEKLGRSIKFFQASSAEIFGGMKEHKTPQTERMDLESRNKYGEAKIAAHRIVDEYRGKGIFACNGILYNHESPLRGDYFVTQKIAKKAVKIASGDTVPLELGNMDPKRDWGSAEEYVEAMYLMMQHEKSDNYIIATNKTTTVREFVKTAFAFAGIDIIFEGQGRNEVGKNQKTGETILKINPEFYREEKDIVLSGDNTKIRTIGWQPQKSWSDVCKSMVESAMAEAGFSFNKVKVESAGSSIHTMFHHKEIGVNVKAEEPSVNIQNDTKSPEQKITSLQQS